jgi:hypothetical protein
VFTDNFPPYPGQSDPSGGFASRYDNDPKSGTNIGDDDIPGPPSVCRRCGIAVIPGTDHSTRDGCFEALRSFVILCQDEIESTRMRDFQHPTREELIQALSEMEDQFSKLVTYQSALTDHIRKLLRGKL